MRRAANTKPASFVVAHLRGRRELLAVVALTLFAAALRLWALDSIPPGLHGDEALTGLDALRVQSDGWIGPYTGSGLGQPTGPLYWAAFTLELTGDGVYALRFSMALLGIMAIPIGYLAFREMLGKPVAMIATTLLAAMQWHLLYSRTGFMVISWPLIELAVLGLLFAALRLRHMRLFVLAGVALGAGIYTYNVYPIFVIAVGLWAVLLILQARSAWQPLALRFAVLFGCAFLVALPLLEYAADGKNDYFSHHRQSSVLRSAAYESADLSERIEILLEEAGNWLEGMTFEARPDGGDGAGARPMLDPLTVALVAGGLLVSVRKIRLPAYQLLGLMLAVLPIAAIISIDGSYRRTLGLAPAVAVLAALPLASIWERAEDQAKTRQRMLRAAVAVTVIAVAAINIQAYFVDVGPSENARFTFATEMAEAAKYMNKEAGDAHVYLYSGRWGFNYETRLYLAPEAKGEDRSKEFGESQGFDVDRSQSSLIMLLSPYTEQIDDVRQLYPDGRAFEKHDGDRTLFIAFHVPPLADAADDTGRK